MMLERGFIVGATRLTKRVWQLYVAHIILFVIYIASISYLALRFGDSEMINEFNVAGLVDNATETLRQGLLLQVQAAQSRRAAALHRADGAVSAGAVVHAAPARPDDAALSIVLWLAARHFGWNCPPIRPATGISTRIAGRCCSCSAPGARWAARGRSRPMINSPVTL